MVGPVPPGEKRALPQLGPSVSMSHNEDFSLLKADLPKSTRSLFLRTPVSSRSRNDIMMIHVPVSNPFPDITWFNLSSFVKELFFPAFEESEANDFLSGHTASKCQG